MRYVLGIVFVVTLGYVVFYAAPSAYVQAGALSFVQFAKGGVTVEVVPGSAMAGSGNPIGVPGGAGLMLGGQYEFTNSKGEKRHAGFCTGHPDFWVIIDAIPNSTQLVERDRAGYRIKFELAKEELEDPHTANSWWVRHMGSERLVRAVPMRE